MTEPRRVTIAPRHPRVLHAGPRVRLMELMLVLHVVLVFLALFLAWLLLKSDERGLALAAVAAATLLLVRDLLRLRALRGLRRVALTGLITRGAVTGSRLTRISRAPRADGTLPTGGQPLVPGLLVEYAFEDEHGRCWTGRFLTSRKDIGLYPPGHGHEVFYLQEDPTANISSLVMRWYWRFGGPAMTDEAPEEDFPLDEDVIVEELL